MQIISRRADDFFSNSEIWHVRSGLVGDVFRVCVTGPSRMPDGGERVGALYVTDGDLAAGAGVSAARTMAISAELPPLFVVSVGYALDHPIPHLVQRTRDFTPSSDLNFDPVLPAMFGCETIVASGGADAFLAFLRDELRPALEGEFAMDPNDAALVGASLGGLFTLHAFMAGGCFHRHLAVSPSIWWGDKRLLRTLAELSASTVFHASLHMCAGEFESQAHVRAALDALPAPIREATPAHFRDVDMIGDMQAMYAALGPRTATDTLLSCAVMPGESHNSVLGVALSHGLRKLYGTFPSVP